MKEVFILQWTFTPEDYFEEPVDFEQQVGIFHIENGKIEARIPLELYPEDHSLRNVLHAELDARFLAVQVISHRPYVLKKSNVAKLYPDGRRDVWAFLEGTTAIFFTGRADAVLTCANGSVVRDTKREGIELKKTFAQSAAKYFDDSVVNAVLRSYSSAVQDPRNELVHLYEILEALSVHFGGDGNARGALGVSRAKWSRLGRLANNEPLNQGHHRGEKVGLLRDASKQELNEAREIARALIEGYLCQHRESNIENRYGNSK
jgi:hypothetical protein